MYNIYNNNKVQRESDIDENNDNKWKIVN
jgi:hypothetical protein